MKFKFYSLATLLMQGFASTIIAQLPDNLPMNNLEVYYSFENNANDYFNNCNGAVNGAMLTNDANGNVNAAYSFDGSGDFIDIPAEFVNGQTLSSQTFRVKFKINESGSYTLWNKDGSWQEVAIYIEPDNSIGMFWAFPNYYCSIRTNSNSINLGVWNDVFIIISSNSGTIFIDGVLQNSYQVNNVPSSNISYGHSGSCGTQYGYNRFGFQKISCNPNRYYLGEIDEFGLWSGALTAEEIQQLYIAEVPEGCTDNAACNFNPEAGADDGSCEYAQAYFDCLGNCLNDFDGDGACDELEVPGCTYSFACNYNPLATQDNGSCELPEPYYDCAGNCFLDLNNNGLCDLEEMAGCTSPQAANYHPEASLDDGSCLYTCLGDLNNDETVDTSDLLVFLTVFGQGCP
jgi:hypothetical protein